MFTLFDILFNFSNFPFSFEGKILVPSAAVAGTCYFDSVPVWFRKYVSKVSVTFGEMCVSQQRLLV